MVVLTSSFISHSAHFALDAASLYLIIPAHSSQSSFFLRPEILTYTRACEHLLSTEITFTDDESQPSGYYVKELSREFFSDGRTVRSKIPAQAPANKKKRRQEGKFHAGATFTGTSYT